MPTAAFTTLGCKVNQYETQRILESFHEAGFDIVPFDAVADVYVINSCSVTSDAESKSRYTIRRASRNNAKAKIVVTGCAAQMALNKHESMAGADVLVPNPDKLDTLRALFRAFPEYEGQANRRAMEQFREASTGRTRATVKIQDGCSVYCSYCSIPFTRPEMRSRPETEVLDEVKRLVEMGYRETILTGVLIGAYGPETGSGGADFESLVEKISDVPGLDRVRISSIETPQVSGRLIAMMRANKVVPHLHIPLQSGDDGVLKDMNRRYTQRDYLALCEKLYAEVPDVSITTDIMVGFPTEDDARFQSTLDVCRDARFLKGHVFRFSPRWGTPADRWGDPVSPQEKQRRSLAVQEATQTSGQAHIRRFLGRTLRVLVEAKPTREGLLHGLTDNYLEVNFAGPISLARNCAWVRVDDLRGGTVYGELAERPTKANRVNPLAMATRR